MLDWLRLMPVFSRSQNLHRGQDPRCTVEKDVRLGNAWLVDRYVPAKPTGASLIIAHGWTLRGKDDARLQAFAQALAIGGVTCTVPHLPGLAMLTFELGDVECLRAVLAASPKSTGMMGFSLGGAYALLAGSGCQDRPRFIMTMGSHAHLAEAFQRCTAWARQVPAVPMDHEAWVYQKLALAWRLREVVPLSPSQQSELRALLEAYCEGENVPASWQFCQRVLGETDWEAVDERRQDPAILDALSPALQPPRLACPVIILHGRGDPTMPASEADRLAEAVRRGSPGMRVDVMITDLLEHVHASAAWRPGEVIRLLRLLSPLVRAGD
jgi:pimeloyl-ACP methyl ester carboxylesterase